MKTLMSSARSLRRSDRIFSGCVAMAAAGVGIMAVSLFVRDGQPNRFFDLWLYLATELFAAVVCVMFAPSRPWRVLGLAMSTSVIGELVIEFRLGGYLKVSSASLADWFFSAYSPLVLVALLWLLLISVKGLTTIGVLIDAAMTTSCFMSFFLWLSFSDVLATFGHSAVERLIFLIPPVCDFLVVAMVAIMYSLVGRKAPRYLAFIGGGMLVQGVADSIYALKIFHGHFQAGTMLDIAWPSVMVILLFALRSDRRGIVPPQVKRTWLNLAGPSIMGFFSLGLLVIDRLTRDVPSAAYGLSVLVIVVAALKALWLYRDLQHLSASQHQAKTDELTGLGNRRRLAELLQNHEASSTRFALMTLDLDRFKDVNDSLGHDSGDVVLREVARRLTAVVSDRGIAIRLSGDEFAVVTRFAEQALAIAAEIHAELCRPYLIGSLDIHLGASVGITVWPDDSATIDQLPVFSDHAMYRTKTDGGGIARYSPTVDFHDRGRLELVEELRRGIEVGNVVPWFQPQVCLETGDILGFEALARWHHPDRGLINPDVAIPLAVRSGLLHSLTMSVLRQALADLAHWNMHSPRALSVSVNVSSVTLGTDSFVREVVELLSYHRLDSSCLVLEVTEETVINERVRMAGTLDRLRDAGVGISIDDYGTGYSSLTHLRTMHATELKLDRTFIKHLDDPVNVAIVRSTVSLAQELGLVLVAEGVEDQVSLRDIKKLGCTVGQGYLWSRPVPANEVSLQLLQRSSAGVTV